MGRTSQGILEDLGILKDGEKGLTAIGTDSMDTLAGIKEVRGVIQRITH